MRHALTRARTRFSAWLHRLFAASPLQTGRLSIARVRFAFGSLLFMLVAGVSMLLNAALERLERERVMRHEVVAARVFDELERELNAHLERESARPSSVYDAPSSQVDAWAPYIVGYFTVADDYRVLSRAQLPAARGARIDAALAQVWPDPRRTLPASSTLVEEADPSLSKLGAPMAKDDSAQKQLLESDKKLAPTLKKSKVVDNSPEVLRRLNRAQQTRKEQTQAPIQEDPFAY